MNVGDHMRPEPIPQLTGGHVIGLATLLILQLFLCCPCTGMGYLEGPKLETALRARLKAATCCAKDLSTAVTLDAPRGLGHGYGATEDRRDFSFPYA